jgi:pyruvate ferredoxin oxidoreductase alpha subunit
MSKSVSGGLGTATAISRKMIPLTGAYAVAEAMRQINPDVVAAYPITPQTPIVEKFAELIANGLVDTEMIHVESEHSSLSACIGAQAAGVRAMTATSSQGLAYMWEVMGIVPAMRLPIVMPVVNRALSGPINIHCDHSDSMGARDFGWIHIFSEDAQEAYENTLLALKLSEHKDVLLPSMVLQDGFITSHGVQNVILSDDDKVKKFIGEYKPEKYLLNVDDPVTFGALHLQDYYFESKRQLVQGMENAKKAYLEIGKNLTALTGRKYEYFEAYNMENADAVIVTTSSAAGTTKSVIDRLKDKSIGLLKIKLFRPFPFEEVAKALENAKTIGVLDRALSIGSNPPLFADVKNALFDLNKKPKLQSYVFGLGGKELQSKDVENIFKQLSSGTVDKQTKYIGVRE